jgi:cytochrome c-type biogenesis protein CcmH/NrfG
MSKKRQPDTTGMQTATQMRAEMARMAAEARVRGDRTQLIAALKGLAELCDRLEDWAGARDAAEELAALGTSGASDASDAPMWTILADARRNLGDLPGAAQAYGQAAARAPDAPMLRRNYAETLILLGRLGEATFQLDIAERLEPDSVFQALRWAELATARGDRAEARRWAEETLRRQPGMPEALAMLQGDA